GGRPGVGPPCDVGTQSGGPGTLDQPYPAPAGPGNNHRTFWQEYLFNQGRPGRLHRGGNCGTGMGDHSCREGAGKQDLGCQGSDHQNAGLQEGRKSKAAVIPGGAAAAAGPVSPVKAAFYLPPRQADYYQSIHERVVEAFWQELISAGEWLCTVLPLLPVQRRWESRRWRWKWRP